MSLTDTALTRTERALDEARAEVERLTRERDAYKKAKSENDERFMLERDAARAEVEHLRLALAGAETSIRAEQMAQERLKDDIKQLVKEAAERVREACAVVVENADDGVPLQCLADAARALDLDALLEES